jgi:HIRAN domain
VESGASGGNQAYNFTTQARQAIEVKTKRKKISLSVVGLQYRTTPSVRKYMVEHLPFRVKLVREPNNLQDPNAIAVVIRDKEVPYDGMKLGYLRRQVANVWAEEIDEGRLQIHKVYLTDLDPQESVGEVLIEATAIAKVLEIGP